METTQEELSDRHNKMWYEHPMQPTTAMGLYLGYSLCCISGFFNEDRTYRELSRKGLIPNDHPLKNSGFVPCNDCYETQSPEEIVEGINKRRLHPYAFPDVGPERPNGTIDADPELTHIPEMFSTYIEQIWEGAPDWFKWDVLLKLLKFLSKSLSALAERDKEFRERPDIVRISRGMRMACSIIHTKKIQLMQTGFKPTQHSLPD